MRTENDGIIEESGDGSRGALEELQVQAGDREAFLDERVKVNADLIGRTALEGEARRHGSFQHQKTAGGYREDDR